LATTFFVSTVFVQPFSFAAQSLVPALAVALLHFSMHLAFSAAVFPLQHVGSLAAQQAGVAAFFSAFTTVVVVFVLVTDFV